MKETRMSTEIFYFSGTGNSLAVAKEIAGRLDAALISIATAVGSQNFQTTADCVGVVFPTYLAQLHGIPLIVEVFITKLDDVASKYIFFVTTCGGYESFNGLPALKNLSRLVKSKGGKVSAEYSVRLPMNTLDYSHIPVPINKDQEKMFRRWEWKVPEICDAIAQRKKSRLKTAKTVLNWMMTPLYLMLHSMCYKDLIQKAREPVDSKLSYRELIRRTDKSISVDAKCNGCATCAKVCPVRNIDMKDDKPYWLHHCEMCLACAEWCPIGAIHHGFRTEEKGYRHPNVTMADMLHQARI
jgi:formate hydrogenlyase subunit 6/NADH:ubiquinone oxidoreductase subunit I/flavodoxin